MGAVAVHGSGAFEGRLRYPLVIDLKRCVLDGHLQNDPLYRQKKRANHADQEYQIEFNHFFCFRKESKAGLNAFFINSFDLISNFDEIRLTLNEN